MTEQHELVHRAHDELVARDRVDLVPVRGERGVLVREPFRRGSDDHMRVAFLASADLDLDRAVHEKPAGRLLAVFERRAFVRERRLEPALAALGVREPRLGQIDLLGELAELAVDPRRVAGRRGPGRTRTRPTVEKERVERSPLRPGERACVHAATLRRPTDTPRRREPARRC